MIDSASGRTVTLSADETALWERTDSDGQDFRRCVREHAISIGETRAQLTGESASVEIDSHDGVTLDAIEVAS